MRLPRSWRWLAGWVLLTLAATATLAWGLLAPQPTPVRAWFTPGPMTHGHHSIELACSACHTDAFGGGKVLQESCVSCHGAQLKAADDSHPKSKFTDPRNADLVKKLDGRVCVSCHVEHRPEITHPMGLSLPPDYCVTCHRDIGKERPTHAGLAFDTCASAGCHNYHDNRALYADFLLDHAHEPALLDARRMPARDFAQRWRLDHAAVPATVADHAVSDPKLARDWVGTAHAQAGVQCTACHAPRLQGVPTAWVDKPDHRACQSCHGDEVEGFLAGKHGMRLAVGLTPMRPDMARLPMQDKAAHRELGCSSCHAAHRFETSTASVDACLGCHADRHSLAYRQSKHFQLWQQEQAGQQPAGTGVSCATCHLPRVTETVNGERHVHVQHNQNDGLRPNEALIRPVCMQCHGLGFSIDALADPELVQRNFTHAPVRHVPSIDMALQHAQADRARRAAEKPVTDPDVPSLE